MQLSSSSVALLNTVSKKAGILSTVATPLSSILSLQSNALDTLAGGLLQRVPVCANGFNTNTKAIDKKFTSVLPMLS